jgi:hypothetical protein
LLKLLLLGLNAGHAFQLSKHLWHSSSVKRHYQALHLQLLPYTNMTWECCIWGDSKILVTSARYPPWIECYKLFQV